MIKKLKVTNKQIGILLLIISFVLLFVSIERYYLGFHNVDLSYNFQKIAMQENELLYKYNISFLSVDDVLDETVGRKIITLQEGYIIGIRWMLEGYTFMFLSGIILTLGLILIYTPKQ